MWHLHDAVALLTHPIEPAKSFLLVVIFSLQMGAWCIPALTKMRVAIVCVVAFGSCESNFMVVGSIFKLEVGVQSTGVVDT